VSMMQRAIGQADIARHVIGWRLNQETRVYSAFDDAAGNIRDDVAGNIRRDLPIGPRNAAGAAPAAASCARFAIALLAARARFRLFLSCTIQGLMRVLSTDLQIIVSILVRSFVGGMPVVC